MIAFEVGAGQAEAVVDILVGQGYTHIVVSKVMPTRKGL